MSGPALCCWGKGGTHIPQFLVIYRGSMEQEERGGLHRCCISLVCTVLGSRLDASLVLTGMLLDCIVDNRMYVYIQKLSGLSVLANSQ